MGPILDSLPPEWQRIVWDNGRGRVTMLGSEVPWDPDWSDERVADLSVYGRYAAIEYATHDLIYCQDDDVIVSDPEAIVDELSDSLWRDDWIYPDRVVANMTEYHQLHHADAPLLGFGSCFHRDAPAKAFARWEDTTSDLFLRTCDVVFAALTPSIVVDVPIQYLPQASLPDRMSRQAGFAVERQKILDLAKKVRG